MVKEFSWIVAIFRAFPVPDEIVYVIRIRIGAAYSLESAGYPLNVVFRITEVVELRNRLSVSVVLPINDISITICFDEAWLWPRYLLEKH